MEFKEETELPCKVENRGELLQHCHLFLDVINYQYLSINALIQTGIQSNKQSEMNVAPCCYKWVDL